MDNLQRNLKVYSLEEIKDEFLPEGTAERKLLDFKLEMVSKLQNLLDQYKNIYTSKDQVAYLTKEIKELIDSI